jgi:hypothetical protein
MLRLLTQHSLHRDLYRICTPVVDFGTRPVRAARNHALMDAVAVLIAVAFIGLLLLLIEGTDRI